jgi:hypothetical protein
VRSGIAPDDEDLGGRVGGQLRADGAPPVGDVVACAGHGYRVDAGGEFHEHGVGVRDSHEVGEKPSPFQPAHLTEAIHRHPGVGRAVAGTASPAGPAGTAGDLERQHGEVAGSHPGDLAAGFDDLDDALVAERVGPLERVPAGEHGDVEIAGGDRDRAH